MFNPFRKKQTEGPKLNPPEPTTEEMTSLEQEFWEHQRDFPIFGINEKDNEWYEVFDKISKSTEEIKRMGKLSDPEERGKLQEEWGERTRKVIFSGNPSRYLKEFLDFKTKVRESFAKKRKVVQDFLNTAENQTNQNVKHVYETLYEKLLKNEKVGFGITTVGDSIPEYKKPNTPVAGYRVFKFDPEFDAPLIPINSYSKKEKHQTILPKVEDFGPAQEIKQSGTVFTRIKRIPPRANPDEMLNETRGFVYLVGIKIEDEETFKSMYYLSEQEKAEVLDLLAETFIPEYNQKIKELTGENVVTFEKKAEPVVPTEIPKPIVEEPPQETVMPVAGIENNEKGEFFGNFPSCSMDGSFSLENKGKGDIYTIYKKDNYYYSYLNGVGNNVRRLLGLPGTFIEPVNQALNAYNPKATSVDQIKPAVLRLEGQKLVLVEKGNVWYNSGQSYDEHQKEQAKKSHDSKQETLKGQEKKGAEKLADAGGDKDNREQKKSYKSTLTHKKGKGYYHAEGGKETLVYFESPKTLIINGYEFITNTNTNNVVDDGNGKTDYILFHDGSRFDGKTGALELAHDDGSTEITVRKLTEQELEELKQKQQKFQDKIGERTKDTPEKRKGFSRINLKRGESWYTLEHNIVGSEMSALQESFVVTFKNVAEVNLKTGEVKKLDGWKEEFEVNVSEEGGKNKTKENQNGLADKIADIERRREEELSEMIRERAIEIKEEDFKFGFIGAPTTFDASAHLLKDEQDKNTGGNMSFYQRFDNGEKGKSFYLVRRPNSNKIYYIYTRRNIMTSQGRPNSFFGMSLEMDSIYCTDFKSLEEAFDQVFEKFVVGDDKILKRIGESEDKYKFNIGSFSQADSVVRNIKAILLKNFKNKEAFGNDFRKSDEFFERLKAGENHILHRVVDGKDTRDFSTNDFDFYGNAINAKYDAELAKLREEADKEGKTKENQTTKPAKPEAKKIVQPPKKPIEKPEPRAETLPPGVFSGEYIKDIVFDLLEEEGKTPESYEIIKDKEGIQTFVLKFTDGTTNQHSVRGVLGLRLKIPIFDLEGIEPVDGGKNFRLVWETDIESEAKERPKSEKEIELAKLLEREQEIDAFREALLKKLEEIERKKKK